MESWGHEVIVVGDKDVESLIGIDIVAFQMAEGGAMGYPGGVFFVTPDKRIFFTSIWEQMSDDNLLKVFPPLAEVKWGLFGRGTRYPSGWHYEYLGMGNHLLVRDDFNEKFLKESDRLLRDNPDLILYNLWLDAVLSIL
jgi:hypothetical protein